MQNKDTRIFKGYKFKIETLATLVKISEIENRNLTNVIENLILERKNELNISVSDRDINEFIKQLNVNKKKKD